jgi:uncharacterized protein
MFKVLLSPAKSIDVNALRIKNPTTPQFESFASKLALELKKKSPKQLGELMSISEKLADVNWTRFQNWKTLKSNLEYIQPVFAFTGEVYRGLDASSLNEDEISYAQQTLRVLSGLYGILKPLDGISPYRLEMGTKYSANKESKNLYEYWGNRITLNLAKELDDHDAIINLASQEYSKVIQLNEFPQPVITPVFKDYKNGKLKTIMMYAKKARGSMARYIVQNRIENTVDLRSFNIDSYSYDEALSNGNDWVFIR